MPSEAPRVYADTSVFGGPFDPEFATGSRLFFEQVRADRLRLVLSEVVAEEIEAAPPQVRTHFDQFLGLAEVIPVTEAALELRRAYLESGIVGAGSALDALHVALASVSRCAIIVSWNFKHIVNFQKIPRYNAVNALRGHGSIAIYSPREVIDYE